MGIASFQKASLGVRRSSSLNRELLLHLSVGPSFVSEPSKLACTHPQNSRTAHRSGAVLDSPRPRPLITSHSLVSSSTIRPPCTLLVFGVPPARLVQSLDDRRASHPRSPGSNASHELVAGSSAPPHPSLFRGAILVSVAIRLHHNIILRSCL